MTRKPPSANKEVAAPYVEGNPLIGWGHSYSHELRRHFDILESQRLDHFLVPRIPDTRRALQALVRWELARRGQVPFRRAMFLAGRKSLELPERSALLRTHVLTGRPA